MAEIPVPGDTARVFKSMRGNCRNFGLLFERFISYGLGWSLEGTQKQEEAKRLVDECNQWATDPAYQAMYKAMSTRWKAMMESAGASPFEASPAWRLVVGLGRESAFETGLTVHRVYGFPYVPGSALKGMTLAWARGNGQSETEISAVFGQQDYEGAAIFFDALPVTPPRLKLDVINPHYPDYYRSGERLPPGDWQSPVPIYFITIEKGTRFLFGVGVRERADREAASVREWLRQGLEKMGVGGKTTSGYGYWESTE